MSSREGRRYVRTEEFSSLKDHVLHVITRTTHPERGWTTPEIVAIINDETPDGFTTYSNPVSGALSRLQNVDCKIVRLKEKRDGFNLYVRPDAVHGRDFYPPRPPNGMEGDRLTPFLVTQVLQGVAGIARKYPKDKIESVLNRVWTDAKNGNVEQVQQAADNYDIDLLGYER